MLINNRAYQYLRDEDARRRLEEQIAQQSAAGMQEPQTNPVTGTIPMDQRGTRQRRVFNQPSPPPMSPEWKDTYDRAQAASQIPIPAELQNVVRGRDVGLSSPWARLNTEGDMVSAQGFDPLADPSEAQRPRRVLESPSSTGTAGRPRFNDPITYDTSGMPERRQHNYGADPMDSAIKHREALENWQPSGERSLGNTARGGGYGVLTAAEKFPNSPEAMIGGGIAGLLGALIKPSSKNWMRRGLAIPQADAEVARQFKIAGDQAKLRQADLNPYFREQTLNQGQQRIDQNRDKLAQQTLLGHKRSLATIYNGLPEFDPDDPKNAALVAAFEIGLGYRPPKKTRGSLFKLVPGTDENGKATFSIVHTPTATATQVTGTGLPAKTEGQLGREAAQEREVYRQGQINQRTEEKEREGGGFTPIQRQARIDKAAELHNEVVRQRGIAERAARALAAFQPNPKAPDLRASVTVGDETIWADEALEIALREAAYAASKLKAGYSDLYETGEGDADQSGRRWAYSKPLQQEEIGQQSGQQSRRQTSGRYAGQRISSQKLPEAAKRLRMTVEQARKHLTDEGAVIY
jgi:hypothetical protein